MKKMILLFMFVFPVTVFAGNEVEIIDIRDNMTMREFTEAGLNKLSSDEMDALNKWLNNFAKGQGGDVQVKVEDEGKKEKSESIFGSSEFTIYKVQKTGSGHSFKINNNDFTPNSICPGYAEGDEVIFIEGRADGMCENAEFSRPDGSDACEVFCR